MTDNHYCCGVGEDTYPTIKFSSYCLLDQPSKIILDINKLELGEITYTVTKLHSTIILTPHFLAKNATIIVSIDR
jgi:hypothetical protein